ncbi:MAG: hypothetical protein IH975_05395 [Nitrospinae bacterium]|nr:hypothetical protein [Nitrospinota bacterium]
MAQAVPGWGISVGLIVLGSILALITSVVVEYLRFRYSDRRSKRLIQELLKGEIPTIISIIGTLTDETEKLGYIPLTRINEISIARAGFDRNRDWLILFKEEGFRRDLHDFYLDLVRICSDAQGIEALVTQGQYTDYIKERRPQLVGKFRSLAATGQSLLTRLDAQ